MTDREAQWRKGYARQALSDLAVYKLLARRREISACHRLHYLQMFLEKTAKAQLWQSEKRSERSDKINSSHKFIEKVLPQVYREFALRRKQGGHSKSVQWKKIKHLCRELDLLAPASDRGGQRPDNCEYPWEIQDALGNTRVIVPDTYPFAVLELLARPEAVDFLKCVEAILPTLSGE